MYEKQDSSFGEADRRGVAAIQGDRPQSDFLNELLTQHTSGASTNQRDSSNPPVFPKSVCICVYQWPTLLATDKHRCTQITQSVHLYSWSLYQGSYESSDSMAQ